MDEENGRDDLDRLAARDHPATWTRSRWRRGRSGAFAQPLRSGWQARLPACDSAPGAVSAALSPVDRRRSGVLDLGRARARPFPIVVDTSLHLFDEEVACLYE